MIPQLLGGGGVARVSPPATGIEVMRVAEDETSFKVLAEKAEKIGIFQPCVR